ncbi:MAG: ubiquitin-like protein Pup [Actinobacteria bacterium]|uniref:Unannotated protein n=1 Tax=freshwater metagenome TaxID=449393 RepID=A0A6J6B8P1_9ZZZZ|nr:ubiquitin-like protein Pup [Actinomycetota bacterium]MTA97367.1 ubiquitin-like protein Pup [Actinomycetota bacterium]
MSERESQRRTERAADEPLEDEVTQPTAEARRDQLDDDVDAILDEIDGVLETNAAEFIASFVQKGGQ